MNNSHEYQIFKMSGGLFILFTGVKAKPNAGMNVNR